MNRVQVELCRRHGAFVPICFTWLAPLRWQARVTLPDGSTFVGEGPAGISALLELAEKLGVK